MKEIITASDNLLKLIGITAAFLVIAGYVNLYSFYRCFDIEIGRYINASEIIVSSFDKFFISLINVILFLLFMGIMTRNPDRKLHWNKRSIYLMVLFLLVGILLITYHKLFGEDYVVLFEIFVVIILATTVFITSYYYLVTYFFPIQLNFLLKYNIGTVLFCPVILTVIMGYNNIDAREIKTSESYVNKTEILFADSTKLQLNDSTLLFIGKTDNFYFIYNRLTKKTKIYPSIEVKLIEQ